jgi:hypothetical protein
MADEAPQAQLRQICIWAFRCPDEKDHPRPIGIGGSGNGSPKPGFYLGEYLPLALA